MEGFSAFGVLTFVLLAFLAEVSSGLVIRSTWSHIRFKSLPPARVDARHGGDLLLECAVSGSPAPQVSWYKDDIFVSHRDWSIEEDVSSIGVTVARLKLNCLTEKDIGAYECRARAGEHEASAITEVNVVTNDVAQAQCVVTGKPVITAWKETLLVEEGDTARLPCRVQESALEYNVAWTDIYGKSATENSDKFHVDENGDLIIKDISFKEMGQYTCTVTGTGGISSIHSFVYPLSKDRNSLNK
eukprot:TRINITY_DN31988_c0_g1_i4.p1 TRINITY_DN31988_c0_g1~~TRINITY_DN31988_c0_g1_i4.p1  ORF type:complete len:244 (+),score=57.54 TRINITY_DN31988_c0_g1_i4:346-1077(+)